MIFHIFGIEICCVFIVFPSRSAGPFASISACLATGDYADYTVKTNGKSTFLGFRLFHAFVKTFASRVKFANISRLEMHVFLEGADCFCFACFFIDFHALEVTLGVRNPLGGLPGSITKNHQSLIPHF